MAGTRVLKVTVLGDSKGAQRAFSGLDSATQRMQKRMTSVGTGMSLGLTVPLVAAGKVAVGEFSEVVQVTEQTRAALESTGGVANVTAGDISNLSARLGEMAVIDGEVVQAAANVLLTFTKVRNEVGKGNDIFDRTAEAALNLSARMGTDLSSAMLQVGKATNDPIKGVSMLGRAGVQFSEDQKFMIQSLVESGDLLGAQKIVLEELETQFGGSAAAAGKARSPLEKLSLAFRDAAESAGAVLVPVLQKVAVFAKSLADQFKALPEPMKETILVVTGIIAVLGPLLVIGAKVVTVVKTIGATIAVLVAGSGPIGLAIIAIGALTFALTKLAGSTHVAEFVNSSLEHIKDFRDGVNEELGPAFTNVATTVGNAIKGVGSSMDSLGESVKRGMSKLQGFSALTKEGMAAWKDEVKGSLDLVSGTLTALGDKAHLTVDKILNAFRKKLDAVSEFGKNIKTLAEKGLSEFAAMTLAKMGEAGAHIAATLVTGTKRDVSQFNRLLKQAEGAEGRFASVTRSHFGSAAGAIGGVNSKVVTLLDLLAQLPARAASAIANLENLPSGVSVPSGGGSSGGSSGGGSQGGYYRPATEPPGGVKQQTTIVQLDNKSLWSSSQSYGDVHRVVLGGR